VAVRQFGQTEYHHRNSAKEFLPSFSQGGEYGDGPVRVDFDLRDALIASSVSEENRGRAFGLEGVGDNAGAFLSYFLMASHPHHLWPV
jgi:hypothetical protein